MPFSMLHNAVGARCTRMSVLAGRVVESADTPAKREDYLRIQGLRLVKPYYFDFVCSVKKRWLGKNIIDVFSEEFASRPRSYYKEAFADGRLHIEQVGKPHTRKDVATADTPLNGNHRMRHFIHRHEPPVLDLPIQVVGETADLIAVSKPASVPVHVCGQYRKNTVMALLQVERPDLGTLHPVHRLDKPVSGLLLVAKNSAGANRVRAQIQVPAAQTLMGLQALEKHYTTSNMPSSSFERALQDHKDVKKVYIARVLGVFPTEPVTVDKPLAWDSGTNHAFLMEPDGTMSAQQSLGHVPDPSQGQSLQAKSAQTDFKLLSVSADTKTSLVQCQPLTGRSHQIRVHLSALGHPIANDTQYGGSFRGPTQVRTHAAVKKREAAESLNANTPVTSVQADAAAHKKQRCYDGSSQTAEDASDSTVAAQADQDDPMDLQANAPLSCNEATSEAKQPACTTSTNEHNPVDANCAEFQVPPELQDAMCLNCPNLIPPGYPTDIVPLWLHARSYSCEDWCFQCPDPAWAGISWDSESSFL